MARVVWRDQALDDLERIIVSIEQFDPIAANNIGRQLVELGESLWHFPRRGRLTVDGTREMTNVPPYILSYRIEGDRVFILSIRHGRRRLPF